VLKVLMNFHNTKIKIAGFAVAAFFICVVGAGFLGQHSESPLPFDREAWKRQKGHEDTNERLRMVGDLKTKLMGISKAEVEQLLGTPGSELEPVTRACRDAGYEYTYLLGVHRVFSCPIDGIWLCINFQSGRVSDVQVMQD
jgi:hypothetical protein